MNEHRDFNHLYKTRRAAVYQQVIRMTCCAWQADRLCQHEDALLPLRCQRMLAEAQQKLSPRQQAVFQLYFTRGMGKKEIAGAFAISEFTAIHHLKSSLSIVRQHVLEQLEMGERKRA